MDLSDPSSESDNYDDDPDYEPDRNGHDDVEETGDNDEEDDGGEDGDEGDEEADEEEDEKQDPSYVPDEEEEDADDLEEEEYNLQVAALPPLPPGISRVRQVMRVETVQALTYLNPEFHIIGFHHDLSVCQKIALWRRGRKKCFDFEPTGTLHYVWRLDLLLRGKNPSRKRYARKEPPVPNAGEYDEEGWTTDEDTQGGGADDTDSEEDEEMGWSDDEEERNRRRRSRRRLGKEADAMDWDRLG